MDEESLYFGMVMRAQGRTYNVLTLTEEEGSRLKWTYARVYVNFWVSVKVVCRQPKIIAPNTCRREEASIDVNESLSSPHHVVLSHLFNVCQPASMQVSLPNASPFMHCTCSIHSSIKRESGGLSSGI